MTGLTQFILKGGVYDSMGKSVTPQNISIILQYPIFPFFFEIHCGTLEYPAVIIYDRLIHQIRITSIFPVVIQSFIIDPKSFGCEIFPQIVYL